MSTLRHLVATTRLLAGDSAASLHDAEVVRHIGNVAGEVAARGIGAAAHSEWDTEIASKAAARIRAGERA